MLFSHNTLPVTVDLYALKNVHKNNNFNDAVHSVTEVLFVKFMSIYFDIYNFSESC